MFCFFLKCSGYCYIAPSISNLFFSCTLTNTHSTAKILLYICLTVNCPHPPTHTSLSGHSISQSCGCVWNRESERGVWMHDLIRKGNFPTVFTQSLLSKGEQWEKEKKFNTPDEKSTFLISVHSRAQKEISNQIFTLKKMKETVKGLLKRCWVVSFFLPVS